MKEKLIYKKTEELLRESEKKYRALFEHAPYSIILVDGETGELVEFNEKAHKGLGYTRDEFRTLKIQDFEVYESGEEVQERLNRIIEQGYDVFETKHRRKDGEVRDILVSCRSISVGGRKMSQSMLTDITDRKKADEQLARSEKQYRDLVNYSLVGIFKTNLRGEILYVNQALCNLFGYSSPEEIMSESVLAKYKNKKDRERLIHILKERSSVDNFEVQFLKRNGDTITVLLSSILEGDSISGMILDISERKHVEEAMLNIAKGVSAKVGEVYFYSLMKHIADTLKADYAYIAEINPEKRDCVRTIAFIADGTIVENIEVNLPGTPCETVLSKNLVAYPSGVQDMFPQAHIITEMNVEGYIGSMLSDSSGKRLGLMSVMYRQSIKNVKMVESVLKIFASRAAAEIERRQSEHALMRAKDEIEKWNEALGRRVRKKTEELIASQAQLIQSEKFSVMGQMAAGLAHELNSPLAGLLPLLEKYLEASKKGSDEYRELTIMLKAAEHMAKVIRDFGSVSRPPKKEYEAVCLNDVIEGTLSFSSGNLRQKGILIVKEYDENIPEIYGDKTELQQVVLNMITNACDAMPDGGEFIIKTLTGGDDGKVVMEFIDNGKGIENEYQDRIFEPFFTTKGAGEGTGLGLSLSYGIINKHSGDIMVESNYGKGTRFTIILPVFNSGNEEITGSSELSVKNELRD